MSSSMTLEDKFDALMKINEEMRTSHEEMSNCGTNLVSLSAFKFQDFITKRWFSKVEHALLIITLVIKRISRCLFQDREVDHFNVGRITSLSEKTKEKRRWELGRSWEVSWWVPFAHQLICLNIFLYFIRRMVQIPQIRTSFSIRGVQRVCLFLASLPCCLWMKSSLMKIKRLLFSKTQK